MLTTMRRWQMPWPRRATRKLARRPAAIESRTIWCAHLNRRRLLLISRRHVFSPLNCCQTCMYICRHHLSWHAWWTASCTCAPAWAVARSQCPDACPRAACDCFGTISRGSSEPTRPCSISIWWAHSYVRLAFWAPQLLWLFNKMR